MSQISVCDCCSYPTSELLHIFYESSPLMMGILEMVEQDEHVTLHFLSHNEATAIFFNRPGQSLRGQTFGDLGLDPQKIQDIVGYYQQCKREREPLSFEYEEQTETGLRWLLVTLNFLRLSEQKRPHFSYLIRDITDRKNAEIERLEIEKRNRELQLLEPIFEIILAGYWDWNFQDNTEYLSPSFKKMLGYEDHELENHPDTWQKLIFAEDLPEVLESINNHLDSPQTVPFYREVRYHHKSGATLWILCSGRVIEWDEMGKPSRMIGCHIDITHQKEAELNLRDINQELETFLENAPMAISRLDNHGQYLKVNPTFAKTLDKNPSELLGQSFYDFFSPEVTNIFEQRLQTIRETLQPLQVEDELDINGVTQYFQTILFPALGSQPLKGFWSISKNITDQKQKAIALRDSEKRYRTIIETTLEGVWVVNSEETTEFVNDQMAKMLGYSASEMMGQPLTAFISPESEEKICQQIRNQTRGDSEQAVYRFCHRDNSDVWLILSTTPLQDTQGNYQGCIGLLTNITEMIQIQDALKVSELQLASVLNSSLDGIMAFQSIRDAEGKIIDFEYRLANPASCTMTGRTTEQLVGHRLLEVMPGHRKDGLFDSYVQVVESGEPGTREFYYNHDEIDSWFENIAVKLGDGFAVTFRDITPIKNYQLTLEKTNQELQERLQDLRERHAEMQTLSQIGDFLQACLTVQEACQVVATLIPPLFPGSAGGIFQTKDSGHQLETLAQWGEELYSKAKFSHQECWGLRRGRPHLISEYWGELHCGHVKHLPDGATTYCIPMVAQGETLGLFYLMVPPELELIGNKRQLAQTVAEQLGLAIANLKLRETLQQQSIRDALTGLYNIKSG
ncbi:PAS domain S-box protein [Sodalinema gerasimenkoae]|uniref:PAS domain S-box protein n=1 Tax=Sodalinema gerasimenkoae TaxID=2862348 RepID=UPI00135A4C3C|nr:PAS domain S-box protein [Sodalinema gerasimenkoae]